MTELNTFSNAGRCISNNNRRHFSGTPTRGERDENMIKKKRII
jgi:hypothetical protein